MPPLPKLPLARLLAALLAAVVAACGGGAANHSLLLITLDTTRADHLPTYGYPRPTAPALDALAAQGVVFTAAFCQETNTNPSHASMFTGLYPHRHGNLDNGYRLDGRHRTLAEHLRAAGFRTAAFVGGTTMRAETTGFERGFEIYDDAFYGPRRPGRETTDRALAWLRDHRRRGRFFLFVHYYDAHGPYRPPPEVTALFRSEGPGPVLDEIPRFQQRTDAEGRPIRTLHPYLDAYDAAIRSIDDQVARLLAAIDPATTTVVVLADHGETLDERHWDLGHGGQVFDEQIRIPWIVRLPGGEGRRVTAPVETVDLLPTLLALLGLPAAEGSIDGRSLLPLLAGGPAEPRLVFSSARPEDHRHADRGYRLDRRRRIDSVRSPRYKLIRYPGLAGDYEELYDLAADPGERHDLNAAGDRNGSGTEADGAAAARAGLRRTLDLWRSRAAPAGPPPELSIEQREQLRALGYLGG